MSLFALSPEHIIHLLRQEKAYINLLFTSKFSEADVKKIWLSLATTRDLKDLHMKIGPNHLNNLAQALQSNQCIRNLNISGTELGDSGLQVLASILPKNTSLREVELSVNSISCTGIVHLCAGLFSNSSIVFLSLGQNEIGDMGARELGRVLGVNSTLKKLFLDGNNISGVGLCDLLASSQHLHCLHLGGNTQIGRNFCLKSLGNLEALNLDNCSLGDSACEQLSHLLARNRRLNDLSLEENFIGEQGVKQLKSALLKLTCPLQFLDLLGNPNLSDAIIADIFSSLFQAERGRLAILLLSAREIPRVGKNSALRWLPSDLVRLVMDTLGRHTTVYQAEEYYE